MCDARCNVQEASLPDQYPVAGAAEGISSFVAPGPSIWGDCCIFRVKQCQMANVTWLSVMELPSQGRKSRPAVKADVICCAVRSSQNVHLSSSNGYRNSGVHDKVNRKGPHKKLRGHARCRAPKRTIT